MACAIDLLAVGAGSHFHELQRHLDDACAAMASIGVPVQLEPFDSEPYRFVLCRLHLEPSQSVAAWTPIARYHLSVAVTQTLLGPFLDGWTLRSLHRLQPPPGGPWTPQEQQRVLQLVRQLVEAPGSGAPGSRMSASWAPGAAGSSPRVEGLTAFPAALLQPSALWQSELLRRVSACLQDRRQVVLEGLFRFRMGDLRAAAARATRRAAEQVALEREYRDFLSLWRSVSVDPELAPLPGHPGPEPRARRPLSPSDRPGPRS